MGVTRSAECSEFWIDRLQLMPHPEGGFYRQTYSASTIFDPSCLPAGFSGPRATSTAIYFLLEEDDFSAFHRIRSDELWHFYAGDALEVLSLGQDGELHRLLLGREVGRGETFQAVVEAGRWFASQLVRGGSFALVGCTVSPGFHFEDFELADRDKLNAEYPEHRALINQLTRK